MSFVLGGMSIYFHLSVVGLGLSDIVLQTLTTHLGPMLKWFYHVGARVIDVGRAYEVNQIFLPCIPRLFLLPSLGLPLVLGTMYF